MRCIQRDSAIIVLPMVGKLEVLEVMNSPLGTEDLKTLEFVAFLLPGRFADRRQMLKAFRLS
jgi:hypothetical protein